MQGGKPLEVERTYVTCLKSGGGFFPLDKDLQVPDGHLLPHAQEAIRGVVVHVATARRHTLATGQRCLEVQTAQAQPRAACPEEPAAERLAMSSDGAMVPLVGGVWAEVKLVTIGTIERRQQQTRRQLSQPPPSAASGPARQKSGRTEAQYRWGRQTFSRRMLQQADGTKK